MVTESLGSWIVRSGAHVLVRPEGGTPDDWTEVITNKVLYFSDEELVKGPTSPTREPVWTFLRDGWLTAVRESGFFSHPKWSYKNKKRS